LNEIDLEGCSFDDTRSLEKIFTKLKLAQDLTKIRLYNIKLREPALFDAQIIDILRCHPITHLELVFLSP
jgi:hypothetical protein